MVKQDIRRLYRSEDDKEVAGVLGGISEYFGLNPNRVRLVYFFLTIVTGMLPGLLAYIVMLIIIPRKGEVTI